MVSFHEQLVVFVVCIISTSHLHHLHDILVKRKPQIWLVDDVCMWLLLRKRERVIKLSPAVS